MDSFCFYSFCAAVVTFFTLLGTIFFMFHRRFRFHQENNTTASSFSISSSSSSSSPPPPPPSSSCISSSSSSSSISSSSCSRTWKHPVFPSFHGKDVRKTFLAHILKEFRRKGIDPFIDNDIKRSKSIGPELTEAIIESRIAIVLLSRNYASSSWCLNELSQIMECRKKLGQIVMTIFYEVDPTDVKKQTGKFGKVFTRTCKGKTKEEVKRWRKALKKVAQIAGEHSCNWDNEAAMMEKIANDVSNMLNYSTPSRDFDGLIGLGAHRERMELLLRLDLDEVRMIGIWGPPGIGKTTIARFLFSQLSDRFQLSVFMENIKESMCTRPVCSDDYSTKLYLQNQFMSQITNHTDDKIPHLGVAQDRLKDKRVLIVLDGIDQLIQLDAIAKDTRWFGLGSRIIVTTQDRKLLKAHGINHIYKVAYPSTYEAYRIFCMYAFGQESPEDEDYQELAWEVTNLLGKLPLGLRVMGSHFRGMSKQEWINALPSLMTRLDASGSIQSILKFSYDALCDEDKDLFLHIACLFNNQRVEKVEEYLVEELDVRQGLHVLADKSLITIEYGWIRMPNLLELLGKEIVRRQSIREPGDRQFLIDGSDVFEVFTDETGSKSVIGIHLDSSELSGELYISERAFKLMSNLKFLRVKDGWSDQNLILDSPQSLDCLSRKVRLLEWTRFPMTCLPSNFRMEYIVELSLRNSKLEKLWEGNQRLGNLMWMDLSFSKNLKELPDLSTATNLQELLLSACSSLVELPSSIGNATNLEILQLDMCTAVVELPSSIGNLKKLRKLTLTGCSKLEVLPTNINLDSLEELDLTDCFMLKVFPEISINVKKLMLMKTAIQETPSSIMAWPHLDTLQMSFSENLKEVVPVLDIITTVHLTDTEMQEIPPWVKRASRLSELILNGCGKLVSIPQLSDSLSRLNAENCESLERLDCCFNNPRIYLNFAYCFKLNKEARDLIIQTRKRGAVLPGAELPAYFTHGATTGGFLTIKSNQRPLPTSMRFNACILLVNKGVKRCRYLKQPGTRKSLPVFYRIKDIHNLGVATPWRPTNYYMYGSFTDHLYIFDFVADVTSNQLFFEFQVYSDHEEIKECGVQLMPSPELKQCKPMRATLVRPSISKICP